MLRLPNLILSGCGYLWGAFSARRADTKKGRKLLEHLATASRLQRRYKSNKRKRSMAQRYSFVQFVFYGEKGIGETAPFVRMREHARNAQRVSNLRYCWSGELEADCACCWLRCKRRWPKA